MGKEKGPQAAEVGRLLGQNLVEHRRHVGLSQQGTADRAGLHRTHVAMIEAGQRLPRLDTIVKLAGAVEVEPCVLLMGMAWELEPYDLEDLVYTWMQVAEGYSRCRRRGGPIPRPMSGRC